jgi:solute carrier family 35 protein E1
LFTVAAYAILFNVSYSAKTYISLLPLTIGVMLVCTFDVSGSNLLGLSCAFGSALIFVSSNIFFKKVMPSGSQTSSHKLDKLNLLLYSSGMAFVLMIPVWLYYDFPILMAAYYAPKHYTHLGGDDGAAATHSVVYYFFLNGTVHFAQNIIAFVILASTSPVTYSIASLIKRVAVICIAILWFAQSVHPIQTLGIVMTFTGLYMYNQAKGDVEQGEHKMRRVEAARDLRLPVAKDSSDHLLTTFRPTAINVSVTSARDRSWTSPVQTRPVDSFPPSSHYSHSQKPFEMVAPASNHSPSPRNHNLHIKVHPPSVPVSPNDGGVQASYPSPPQSVDSPPASPPLAGDLQGSDFDSWMSRRATVAPVR